MAQSALATPIPDPQRTFNAVPDVDPDQTPESSPQVVEPTPVPVADAEALASEEARQHGWVSREEWEADGRPVERWKPASEFLDIRRNIQSVLKDENRELRARLAAMEAWKKQNEQRTVEAQTKLSQSEVLSQMRQAAEEGDWSKHAELTDKLTDLKAAARTSATPQAATPGVDPDVQDAADEFKNARENQPIFKDRQLARAFATQLKAITSIDPNLSAADALKEAKDLTMRLYPERFRNLNRTRPAMFETNGTSTASTNGKTWADLSPSYRAQAEVDIAAKKYTKDEFLAACADQPDAWRH